MVTEDLKMCLMNFAGIDRIVSYQPCAVLPDMEKILNVLDDN